MPLEQEPERERTGMRATVDRLERADVPAVVQQEILRLSRSHALEIGLEYADDGTTIDVLEVRDAATGERLLFEDFAAYRREARKSDASREHAARQEPRGTVVPDTIEPSLLRGKEGERGS